ncbi:MAG: hypothetical protein GF401_06480 [Chitinivibrionales bacterium]|nr:hypothetical protein [Chitinivibrionales bacterium]
MFRNKLAYPFSLLWILPILLFCQKAVSVGYSLQSFSSDQVKIQFTATGRELQGSAAKSEFTLGIAGYTPLGPDVRISLHSPLTPSVMHPEVVSISKGWAGTDFYHWIVFSLGRPSGGSIPDTIQGMIDLSFSSPVFASTPPPFIRNGVLHAMPLHRLSKAAGNTVLPDLPYTRGIRIEIDEDGIYEIPGARLEEMGVAIDRISSRYYHLFQQGKEIPIYITNSHREHLAPQEKILFYGKHLRGTKSFYPQYSNTNVYWLTWESSRVGLRIAEGSVTPRIDETAWTPGDTAELFAREFRDTLHFEEDNDIRWLGDINAPQDIAESPSETDVVDNWYWGGIGAEEITQFTIDIPSPSTSAQVRMRFCFMGITSVAEDQQDHRISILVNGDSPGGIKQTAVWDGQTGHIFETGFFSLPQLKHGANTITFITEPRSYEDRVSLNWIEVEYNRTFSALYNRILFKNNPSDINAFKQFTVTGFTTDNIDVWDLTNSRVLHGFTVRNEFVERKSSFALVFQDSLIAPTRFLAQATSLRKEPLAMSPDAIRKNFDFSEGLDYLMITSRDLKPSLEPLAAFHAARGLRTEIITIEDIYNRFTYGIKNPESIRLLVAHIFSKAGSNAPRYILLGGDTSHDLDKNQERKALNIVPTHLSRIPGWGPCSDDSYFATVRGDDNFPDCYVGRFPARNSEDMETLVNKAIKYHSGLETGYWRDNLLLIGGFEEPFSSFNDAVTSDHVGPAMHTVRLDAYPSSKYYQTSYTGSNFIIDHLNAGVYAVNFNGHGGGNVWSDNNFLGIDKLSRLHNDQWPDGGRLPFIFSFTCLTGFFESVFYRSLGEEFIRRGMEGAIGFYGASAYTSQSGNLIMNGIMLRDAVSGTFESIGELLWLAEMKMLVRDDIRYLPLVRQYNLLGDPSIPWELPPDSLVLSLKNNSLAPGDSLSFTGITTPLTGGKVKLRVMGDNITWNERLLDFGNSSFSAQIPVKDSSVVAEGMVRAYAWNDSMQITGWTGFSKSLLNVSDITLPRDKPHYGDTVSVACKIAIPPSTSTPTVMCMYAIDYPYAENPDFNRFSPILMHSDSAGNWTTEQPLRLEYTGKPDARLLVKFRLSGSSSESSVYSFDIAGTPDLRFTTDSLVPLWINDSLGLSFEIVNSGNHKAPPFTVSLFMGTPLQTPFREIPFGDSLMPGKTVRFTPTLPDTQGVHPLSAWINYDATFTEIYRDNNEINGTLSVHYTTLHAPTDTLWSKGKGVHITPPTMLALPHVVFLFGTAISVPSPLSTESSWIPLIGDSVKHFSIGTRPSLSPADSLRWTFHPDSGLFQPTLAKKSAPRAITKKGVMSYDSTAERWQYITRQWNSSTHALTITSVESGPFAPANCSDMSPPKISVAVAGRKLVFLDYAAKDKPFDIFITDPSGIVPSSVEISVNSRVMDQNLISPIPESGDLETVRITAYPQKQRTTDSISIYAQDFAGNDTCAVFAYLPGENLSIKFLACHPNPFTARQNADGETAQTTRLAYLLTDVADKVNITIFTIGGKKVRTWSFEDIIGYQEVEWDGKSQHGYRIANGTYYVKLTARNDRKRVKKFLRIAKCEGY